MIAHLEIWGLTKSFPGPSGPTVVVKDFELRLEKGEFVCVIGHSGCGKSTVLSMLAGLTRPTAGAIALAGKEVVGPGPDRGVVFQSPCLLPWMTSRENVLLGVEQVFPHVARKERVRLADHYLELVGLGEAGGRKAAALSAGMRQRVGIARAFALAPKILLLDEPFGMLDSLTRCDLQQVLMELCARDRKTAFMVTHDVDEALFLSDRVVMMTSGPAARVGAVLDVPFARPRDRRAVLDHPDYHRLRDRLLSFLEGQSAGFPGGPGHGPAPGNERARPLELLSSAT